MKTKIIYISGNELFDVRDIRAAFDEVRTALSLAPDTVLFGVPVDSDDALTTAQNEPDVVPDVVVNQIVEDTPIQPKTIEPEVNHAAKVVPISKSIKPSGTISEPESVESENSVAPSVVPILSVLGSKSDEDEHEENFDDEKSVNEPTDIDSESENIIDNSEIETETVTINDMIADEAPAPEHEKTLEELLESMTPLGEDPEKTEPSPSDISDEEVQKSPNKSDNDIDITLEKLATEFVENQDKIGIPPKPASRGKIGKLKNILPFKKAKHDDSGLMGDLFGWAGVAANDDEFTVPGFFK